MGKTTALLLVCIAVLTGGCADLGASPTPGGPATNSTGPTGKSPFPQLPPCSDALRWEGQRQSWTIRGTEGGSVSVHLEGDVADGQIVGVYFNRTDPYKGPLKEGESLLDGILAADGGLFVIRSDVGADDGTRNPATAITLPYTLTYPIARGETVSIRVQASVKDARLTVEVEGAEIQDCVLHPLAYTWTRALSREPQDAGMKTLTNESKVDNRQFAIFACAIRTGASVSPAGEALSIKLRMAGSGNVFGSSYQFGPPHTISHPIPYGLCHTAAGAALESVTYWVNHTANLSSGAIHVNAAVGLGLEPIILPQTVGDRPQLREG